MSRTLQDLHVAVVNLKIESGSTFGRCRRDLLTAYTHLQDAQLLTVKQVDEVFQKVRNAKTIIESYYSTTKNEGLGTMLEFANKMLGLSESAVRAAAPTSSGAAIVRVVSPPVYVNPRPTLSAGAGGAAPPSVPARPLHTPLTPTNKLTFLQKISQAAHILTEIESLRVGSEPAQNPSEESQTKKSLAKLYEAGMMFASANRDVFDHFTRAYQFGHWDETATFEQNVFFIIFTLGSFAMVYWSKGSYTYEDHDKLLSAVCAMNPNDLVLVLEALVAKNSAVVFDEAIQLFGTRPPTFTAERKAVVAAELKRVADKVPELHTFTAFMSRFVGDKLPTPPPLGQERFRSYLLTSDQQEELKSMMAAAQGADRSKILPAQATSALYQAYDYNDYSSLGQLTGAMSGRLVPAVQAGTVTVERSWITFIFIWGVLIYVLMTGGYKLYRKIFGDKKKLTEAEKAEFGRQMHKAFANFGRKRKSATTKKKKKISRKASFGKKKRTSRKVSRKKKKSRSRK